MRQRVTTQTRSKGGKKFLKFMNTAVSVFPVHCKKEMGKYDKLGKVAFNGEWSVESKERNKIEKKRSANDTRN